MQRVYMGLLSGLFCVAPLRAVIVQVDHMVHPNGSSVVLAGDVHLPHEKASNQRKALLKNCLKFHLTKQLQTMIVEDEHTLLMRDKKYRIAWLFDYASYVCRQIIPLLKYSADRLAIPCHAIAVRKESFVSGDWPKQRSASGIWQWWRRVLSIIRMPKQADVPSVYEVSHKLDLHVRNVAARVKQYQKPALIEAVQVLEQLSGKRFRAIVEQFPKYAQICREHSLREVNELHVNRSQQCSVHAGAIRQLDAAKAAEWQATLRKFDKVVRSWGIPAQSGRQRRVMQWLNLLDRKLFDVALCDRLLSATRPGKTIVACAGLAHTDFAKRMLLQSGYRTQQTVRGHWPSWKHPKNPQKILDMDTVFAGIQSWHRARASKL